MHDALCVVRNLVKDGRIVYGGGAAEIACSLAVSNHADEVRTFQVWSLTRFYSVDFSKSRIGEKKCVFNKRTIKVCVSCC